MSLTSSYAACTYAFKNHQQICCLIYCCSFRETTQPSFSVGWGGNSPTTTIAQQSSRRTTSSKRRNVNEVVRLAPTQNCR